MIRLAMIFSLFFVPAAKAKLGDNYTCLSSHYLQIIKDKPVRNLFPVTFRMVWTKPQNEDFELIYFPENEKLMVGGMTFTIQKSTIGFFGESAESKDFTSFILTRYPGQDVSNNSPLINGHGILDQSDLYLSFTDALLDNVITNIIARCDKRNS